MKYTTLIFLVLACLTQTTNYAQNTPDYIHVLPTQDFKISCNDINKKWESAQWNELVPDHADPRATRVKTLYSQTVIYFLYFNEDKKPTSTKKNDFDSLWVEDVAEVFLWPDTSMTVYFEYEIAPTNGATHV